MKHPGIELRVSLPSGPLVEANSDQLYWIAKYGGAGEGWYDLLDYYASWRSSDGLAVEVRPVMLPDGWRWRRRFRMLTRGLSFRKNAGGT